MALRDDDARFPRWEGMHGIGWASCVCMPPFMIDCNAVGGLVKEVKPGFGAVFGLFGVCGCCSAAFFVGIGLG